MALRARGWLGAAIPVACALVAGCSTDLFHGTEWASLCDRSPADRACSGSVTTGSGEGGAGGAAGPGGGGQGGAGGEGGSGPPPIAWSRSFGDALDQRGSGVAVAPGGDVVLAGRFEGALDLGEPMPLQSAGGFDLFLLRLDPAGATVWGRRFGDALQETSKNVAVDARGNVLETGHFGGTLDFGLGPMVSAGGQDVFLAKLTSQGEPLLAQRWGDAGQQRGHHVAVAPDGSAAIIGTFAGTIAIEGETLTSAGSSDVFVIRLDPDGALAWARSFGGLSDQNGLSVALTPSGTVLAAGYYLGQFGLGGPALPDTLTRRPWVAALDGATGGHVWSRDLGPSTDCTSPAIASDAQGNAVVVGGFNGTLALLNGLTSAGGMDAFAAKLGATDGADLWARRAGDAVDQIAIAVTVDASNRVLVAGRLAGTADFGGGALASAGLDDVFLLRLAEDGDHLTSARYGDAGSQEVEAIAARGAEHVVVTGWFDGAIDFGSGALTATSALGTYDVFVAQLPL